MSELIMCDRCKNKYFTDSRSDKGAYCEIRIIYTDGNSTLHLCKSCYRLFRVNFMRQYSEEQFDDEFGASDPAPYNEVNKGAE
jgi:hypothetical protein